jgi:hypothetical protein
MSVIIDTIHRIYGVERPVPRYQGTRFEKKISNLALAARITLTVGGIIGIGFSINYFANDFSSENSTTFPSPYVAWIITLGVSTISVAAGLSPIHCFQRPRFNTVDPLL